MSCAPSNRWGCIHVFKSEKHNPQRLTVRAGLTRLTLFPGNVDLRIANVNDDRSALSRSTPMAAFIRCGRPDNYQKKKVRQVCVSVFFHVTSFSLPVDIQHGLVSVRCFFALERRVQALWSRCRGTKHLLSCANSFRS